jgi:GxxExxY protein
VAASQELRHSLISGIVESAYFPSGFPTKYSSFASNSPGRRIALPVGMAIFSQRLINSVSHKIIGAAIEVHRRLGPGLFESVYHKCVVCELRLRGVRFVSEHPVPLVYKGEHLDAAFILDLFVEELIVVELKCVEALAPVHEAQLLTQVRLTNAPIGLLINFNVAVLKNGGIKRKINENHELVDEFNPIHRAKHKDWFERNKK